LLVCGGLPRVKQVTPLLIGRAIRMRAERRVAYVHGACAGGWAPPLPLPAPQGLAAVDGLPAGWVDGGGQVDAQPAPPCPVTAGPDAAEAFLGRQGAVWRLRWENCHKEVLWRLALNGVPGAGGHDVCPRGPCPCGWHPQAPPEVNAEQWRTNEGAPALRQHYFWDCPVAQAVLHELSAALPPGVGLHCAHLWLCLSPTPRVVQAVWEAVCLAALSAMDQGRRTLWALHFSAAEAVPGEEEGDEGQARMRQLTLFEAWGVPVPLVAGQGEVIPDDAAPAAVVPPAPLSIVQRASRAAVAGFWKRLQDFVSVQNQAGVVWRYADLLSPDHAFVSVQPAAAGANETARRPLRVTLPPGAALPL
jgi:hypothetical protein